jgi:cytochrome P450
MTTGAQPTVKEQPVPPRLKPAYPGKNLVALIRAPIPFLGEAARHGDVVRVSDGGQDTYLINNPEYIRDILVINHRNFHKSPVLRRMGSLLGQGLLTSEDELHLRQRRLIQPAFHRQRIAEYARIMTDYTEKTGARWQDGQIYDIHEEMMRLTMVIVGHALFGTNVESEASEIGEAITTLLAGSRRLLLPFWEKIQHWPIAGNRRIYAAGEVLDAKIREMIAERRKMEQGQSPASGQALSLQHDLLDMLLRARDDAGDGKGMSDELVRDEVITLFIAGHETTSNALTWTWYLLSQHPEVETRLHAELESVLGRRTPTADDFEKLEYTRRVLSESMRLYPPAWTISRQALEEYPVGPYVLPKGSVVLMSQWVMHHDARYYPDPFRFDPERWTPEAVAARPRYAYFPFGGGPRLCVGEPFAWMEGVLVLAMLAQRWQLRLDPTQRVGLLPQVTLRPKYGMRMRVEKR